MKKHEALIQTGKLEVLLEDRKWLLEKLHDLQKSIMEYDNNDATDLVSDFSTFYRSVVQSVRSRKVIKTMVILKECVITQEVLKKTDITRQGIDQTKMYKAMRDGPQKKERLAKYASKNIYTIGDLVRYHNERMMGPIKEPWSGIGVSEGIYKMLITELEECGVVFYQEDELPENAELTELPLTKVSGLKTSQWRGMGRIGVRTIGEFVSFHKAHPDNPWEEVPNVGELKYKQIVSTLESLGVKFDD